MIILDKFNSGTPTVDLSKGEDFKSMGLQIDFECALAIYDLSHIEYTAETKAIEAYTEASGVESLYAPQFKVLTEEANEGFKAKFTNVMGKIKKFFTEMWQRFSNWINRILVSDEKMIKKIEKNIADYAPKKISTIDHAKCVSDLSEIREEAEEAFEIIRGKMPNSTNPDDYLELFKKIEDVFKTFKDHSKARGDKSYKDGIIDGFKETISEKEVNPGELLQVYKDALSTFKTFNKKTFSFADQVMKEFDLKFQNVLIKSMAGEDDRKRIEDFEKQIENDTILVCKEINNLMSGIAACISYLYGVIRSDFNKLVK